MLFDKLCGIVERPDCLRGPARGGRLPPRLIDQLTALRQVVDRANVFEYPAAPYEIAFREAVIEENRELLGDRFCLPFPAVAVEDRASCVILHDTVPGAKGLAPERGFVEVYPVHANWENFGHRDVSVDPAVLDRLNLPADAMNVYWGSVLDVRYDDFKGPRARFAYRCGGAMIADRKGVYLYALGEDAKEEIRGTLENVRVAIEEMAYANMPSRWVVEVLTAASHQAPTAGRLRRSHQRPRFTTLTPGELRKLFGREREGDRKSPIVHERRGHWRLLQSERFAKSGRKGEHLWIEATWVGETEAVVGSKKYVVRTDL